MKNLDQCYQQYAKEVYLYIYSLCQNPHIAEDILSVTFYRAYHHLDSLQDERLKAWLLRVAYHAFVDYTRKEKRSHPQPPEYFQHRAREPDFTKKLLHQETL